MRRLRPEPQVDLTDLWDLYALPPEPHVRAGFVTSLDGSVAVDGRSSPLSGPADRTVLRTLRAVADVVLVGAGTARAEDYGPAVLTEELRERRRSEGRGPRPAMAVVTRSRGLNPRSRLLQDPDQHVLLLTTRQAADRSGLPAHVEVVVAGHDDVVPALALTALRERGLDRVLCEGGPELLQQLLAADAVDELCLTLSPLLVGGGPTLLPRPVPGSPRTATLRSVVEADGMLLTRWGLRDQGAR